MAKTIKLSRNPKVAFLQGREVGRSIGVEDGFQTALYMALPAYYNTKPDDLISDEEFGKWVAKAELEAIRIFNEDFRGDFDMAVKAILTEEQKTQETIEDNVKYGMGKIRDLRRHLNLEDL